MNDIAAVKYTVQGRVQGVGFRWFVLNEAKQLYISGTVKNLPNGNVEIFAQGEISQLYKLKNLLKKGPSFARVDRIIETEDVFNEQLKEFRIIY